MNIENSFRKELIRNLAKTGISFSVTLIILGIIAAIILKLPYMTESITPYISIGNILSTAVSVAFIVTIIFFGKMLANNISLLVPLFPGIGLLIIYIMILVVIIIGYVSFDPIVINNFKIINLVWLYPVIFLALAIFPIAMIIMIVYKNSGNITYLFKSKKTAQNISKNICLHCGSNLGKDADFCNVCGFKVTKASKLSQSSGFVCKACGLKTDPNSQFCKNCGAKIIKGEQLKVHQNICPKCNTELDSDAAFCSKCGTRIK